MEKGTVQGNISVKRTFQFETSKDAGMRKTLQNRGGNQRFTMKR